MEVHPPHAPLHNWKDFWIHLGTITIGLLIAISLEQSVELVHHMHQRAQLEDDLHAEGVRNLDLVAENVQIFEAWRAYMMAVRHTVDSTSQSGGKTIIPYPIQPKIPTPAAPSDAVWATARESTLIELLPRQRAEIFARLYRQHELAIKESDVLATARFEVVAFEDRFSDERVRKRPDLSLLTLDEQKEYSVLLTRFLAAWESYVSRLKTFAAATRAVLDGADTEQDMRRRMHAALEH